MKENKNLKAFQALTNACMDKKDTFFGVYFASNDKEGITQFVGNPKHFGIALSHILTRACSEDATEQELELGNTILNSIAHALSKPTREANILMQAIGDVFEHVKKEHFAHLDDVPEAPEDFDPQSDVCTDCEEYVDCLARWAVKHIREVVGAKRAKKRNRSKKGDQGNKK